MNRKVYALVLLMALVGGLVGGLSPRLIPTKVGQTIEAREFIVVDKEGNRRTVLSIQEDGNPILIVSNKDGQALFLTPNRILMMDKSIQPRAQLLLDKDENPTWVLYDKDHNICTVFGVDGTSSGRLVVAHDKSSLDLSISAVGTPMLSLTDTSGVDRVTLGISTADEPEPGLWLFDKGGRVIWKAP